MTEEPFTLVDALHIASPALARPKKNATLWERSENDWYQEPPRATEGLLTVESFVGSVHDPACGSGTIVKVCRAHDIHAWGSDIKRRVPINTHWFAGEHDWLDGDWPETFDNIITNPPYFRAKGVEAFAMAALERTRGKVALFVDIRFLAGADRAKGLFHDHPPTRVWIITPRVSCPPGSYLADGKKAGNGSADYCWMVWDRTVATREPRLGWIRVAPGAATAPGAAGGTETNLSRPESLQIAFPAPVAKRA